MRRPGERFRVRRARREPGRTADPDEVASAREIVLALEKIEKTAALYPPGAPTIVGFADELHAKAAALLARTRVIDLAIGANEIEYEGEVVFDGGKAERSLAFTLEDGGVRRLVLVEGLDRAEVGEIVAALGEARGRGAEDLVTLLWQRDLQHVSFVAASVYADPDEEAALADLDGDAARAKLVDRVKGRDISVEQLAMIRGSARGSAGESTQAAEESPEVFALRPEDEQGLQRWLDRERDATPAERHAEVLLLLLERAKDEESLRARAAGVARAVEELLEDGEPLPAAELIAATRRAAEASPAGVRALAPGGALRALYQSVASAENGARLARFLTRSRDDESFQAVRLFISSLGKHALLVAADLLDALPDEARLVAALATACRDDLAEVRQHAADPNPKVALAALHVLAEAVGEAGIEDYRRALLHRHPHVRKEALFIISRSREARALDPIVDAFADPDPEVRLMALRALPATPSAARPELYQRVLKLVEDERGREPRSRIEQELLFAALGRLDAEQGYAYLEAAVHHYPFLQRERAQRRRLLAIAALGELAGARAEAFLYGLESAAKSPDIRAAARAAIERIGTVRRSVKIIARRPAAPPSPADAAAPAAGTGTGPRPGDGGPRG